MNGAQAHFEVFEAQHEPGVVSADGKTADWRWRLRAANGEIVAQSEGYTRKQDAERGAFDARAAAAEAVIRS